MNSADLIFKEGLIAHRQGKLDLAQSLYQQALTLDGYHAEAWHLTGVISLQKGDWQSGVNQLVVSLTIEPQNPVAHNNLGNALLDQNIYDQAIEHYDIAISLNPSYAQAHLGLGQALRSSGRHYAAEASLAKAIQIKPELLDAHLQLALTQAELFNFEPALKQLTTILKKTPSHPACLSVYNDIQKAQNMHLLRLQTLVGQIKIKDVDTLRGQAQNLFLSKRFSEAIELLDAAIAIDPLHARTYYNKGICHGANKQYLAAIECYDRSTTLDPQMDEAWHNCGSALFDIQQFDDAIFQYDKSIQLNVNPSPALFMKLYAKQKICDWSNWDNLKNQIIEKINLGHCPIQPLPILALTDSVTIQLQAGINHFRNTQSQILPFPFTPKNHSNPRIKIGYFSQDFRNHAVAFLTAELFELHDRNDFEIHGFDLGWAKIDNMQQRLKSGFEFFHDVREMTDQSIVEFARQMELDIAVDLSGYTLNNRNGIFTRRLAPVQINYIGYPATMGHPEMDYIIGDRIVIPDSLKNSYSEKVISLPCFQVNDRKRAISERVFTHAEIGIPKDNFIFCGINAPHKLSPLMMTTWMEILKQVPQSVLMLFKEHDRAERNIREFAEINGVDPDRLIFVTRLDPADNLARYQLADLFLDIVPFNGGTTVSDALWAGLPVITCTGEAFASRMASSLLTAVGLPELIAKDLYAYAQMAVELATKPVQLNALKQKLAARKDTCILFNTPLFTKKIEEAYKQAHERYMKGLKPDHITV